MSYKYPITAYDELMNSLNLLIENLESLNDTKVTLLLKHLEELKDVMEGFFKTRNHAYEFRYFNESNEEINEEDFNAIEGDIEIDDDKNSVKSQKHINPDNGKIIIDNSNP